MYRNKGSGFKTSMTSLRKMSRKATFVFVAVVSFVAISAVNAQESANDLMRRFVTNIPENCQDAIKRFPENLRVGWERGYIAATSTGRLSDDDFLVLAQSSLMANFVKTNILLKGNGNEKMGDSNVTYSQYYQQLKVVSLQATAMLQMLTAATGNSGGINWTTWEQNFMAFL